MDDEEKAARFQKQCEILERMNKHVDGRFRWRNSNHKIYSHRPALKPIDRQKLIDEVNVDLNELLDS